MDSWELTVTIDMYCHTCGTASDGGRFCENCGSELTATDAADPAGTGIRWLSSAIPTSDGSGHNGYRASDRTGLDLGLVGAATDLGRKHHYNQDAVAIGRHGDISVAVVCDGVSNSNHGEHAALAAVRAAAKTIVEALADKQTAEQATRTGVAAAAQAASEAGDDTPDNPPSCTYVSAVITDAEVVVCWIGDSRAYWVGPDSAACLTVDDTIAGRLAHQGVPRTDERYSDPYATALLAWLGKGSPEPAPNIARYTPAPGQVVVCSDGLSRYLNEPADLVAMTQANPADMAGSLTVFARDSGGVDNISVTVGDFPPIDHTPTPRSFADVLEGSASTIDHTTAPEASTPVAEMAAAKTVTIRGMTPRAGG